MLSTHDRRFVVAVLRQHNAAYSPALMPLSTLHITVCLLRLDTPEQQAKAARVFRDSQSELRRDINDLAAKLNNFVGAAIRDEQTETDTEMAESKQTDGDMVMKDANAKKRHTRTQ